MANVDLNPAAWPTDHLPLVEITAANGGRIRCKVVSWQGPSYEALIYRAGRGYSWTATAVTEVNAA